MKNARNLIIGIVIGGIVGFVLYPLVYNNPEKHAEKKAAEQSATKAQLETDTQVRKEFTDSNKSMTLNSLAIDTAMNRAIGITRSTADDLFQYYHQSRDPDSSLGVINVMIGTETQKLRHFFLSYDKVIRPLKSKIDGDSDHSLVGFAGLPAFNDTTNSHTMVWVAVVENDSKEYHYYLPSNEQADDVTFIYDFIDVCPNDCPRNEARIWKEDWKE